MCGVCGVCGCIKRRRNKMCKTIYVDEVYGIEILSCAYRSDLYDQYTYFSTNLCSLTLITPRRKSNETALKQIEKVKLSVNKIQSPALYGCCCLCFVCVCVWVYYGCPCLCTIQRSCIDRIFTIIMHSMDLATKIKHQMGDIIAIIKLLALHIKTRKWFLLQLFSSRFFCFIFYYFFFQIITT